jgi:LuxR family transcriptional regulator, maltose regulon positive regulatory protein
MSAPLLTTQFYIPPPVKFRVDRARLVERLHECRRPGCRLTLISAPAGFGKTTLVSTWVAAVKALDPSLTVAWLSLDSTHNDPVIFWTYLISALQIQQEGIGKQALNLLLTSQTPELDGKLAALVNDLVQISHPFILILDDYHLIRNPVIHQSLSFFIEHIPPQFHLILVSRTDPPLPLALLRGRGQLLEFRLSDLRFSMKDADAYLNAGMGLNLAAAWVNTLNQKAEGWIAGLQMAALSLREAASIQDHEKMERFIASFSGSNRYILDYLIEEVLVQQPEPIQNFLMRTSILDRLCGPLCDALLQGGEPDAQPKAQTVLQYLENSNLFIIPLDDQRYWYRYHHLFTDLLRKRLAQTSPEIVPELHRRAIDWYEQNGWVPKAVEHAFQLKNFHKAASLISQISEEMWGRGEHTTLLAWLDALPEEEKGPYPHLWVFQVSMLITAGRLQEAEGCIPAIENYIRVSLASNPEQTSLRGNVFALRTYIASFYGDNPGLFNHARLALEHLTREEDAGQRCGVSLVLSNAYLTQGDLEAAARTLIEAIAAGKKAHKPHMVLTGMANLVVVLWFRGDLKRAARVCQEGLLLVQQNGLERSPMAADLFVGWGEILCEQHALQEAEKYIHWGLELGREQTYIWPFAWACLAQTRLLHARGNLVDAEAAAQEVEQLARMHAIPDHFACGAAGLKARIWIRQGKLDLAQQYLQSRKIQADSEFRFPHQSELLALSRLFLARGDLESAASLLESMLHGSEVRGQTGEMISALLLQSLVCQAQGNLQYSLQSLRKALGLAEPEGYAQTFVDEGEPMLYLLAEAARQNIHSEYAGQLLKAFPDFHKEQPSGAGSQIAAALIIKPEVESGKSQRFQSEKDGLLEPLSKREMEILRWIAEGCSNKEIAQKLYLSLRTVKYYSTNLYTKLGVDGRMQAVNRARELGLL